MQANHKMTVAAFALSSLAMMVSGIGTGFAQNMVRVRGTIDHIERSAYLVKARDGAELKVALQPADRRRGQGTAFRHQAGLVTAMPRADGSQSALEVHIFPEAMRGTGEGHYPNRRAQ